jgi:mannosidase alpha-like ER degradation enhancer 3
VLFVLQARTPTDAEEGLLFMQEMVELAKSQSQLPDTPPQAVTFTVKGAGDSEEKRVVISAGPAHFGRELRGNDQVSLIVCCECLL